YITDKALLENEGARTQKVQYEMSDLEDFEYLLNNFYTVDKTTTIGNKQLYAKAMLEKDYSIKKDEKKILIYHTHSQEGYVDSIEGDLSTTVVGVGEHLKELLEGYGYQVIHHKGQYDVTSRDYAYTNSAPAIEKLLSENPDIEIIIDLHRDGVAEDRHLVTEIDGKPMAQFMFLNGLSFTTTYGNIEYLPNPYIADNLGFAFQLQLKSAEYYPSLARKVYLKGYRYNMHYMPRSLLVEVGAQTNTLEEAMNTMEPLAHILDMILSEESAK
ncbi:MAG TPA: stage II sporulation protein P, partial [Lachnospiraceae bacterium]|nr:stage II sporulation protein P [Lachnospiraceae bacterium]